MRASQALTYEPAACWRRLQQSKEFFFEDLDAHMKAPTRAPSWSDESCVVEPNTEMEKARNAVSQFLRFLAAALEDSF
jgi:hypothetical protein